MKMMTMKVMRMNSEYDGCEFKIDIHNEKMIHF